MTAQLQPQSCSALNVLLGKLLLPATQELDNLDNLSFAVKHTRKLLVMLTSVLVKETQRDLIHKFHQTP